MDNIFGSGTSQIFKDRSVLSPRYLPDKLVGREEEIKEFVDILRPILHRGEPANAIVMGNKGVGKTTVVRYVLKQLGENIEKEDLKVIPIFINCQKINTTSRIILEMINKIAPDMEMPRTGLSMGRYYRALWKAMNKTGATIIVVFDGIEALKDQNILHNLSHAAENLEIEDNIFLSIIGIADELNYSEELEHNISTALQQRNIVFTPYKKEQINQILEQRSIFAFAEEVLNSNIVQLCAEITEEDGNASKAIALLERTGDVADRSNSTEIIEDHFNIANEEMGNLIMAKSTQKLPFHSKIVLLSIVKLTRDLNDSITTGQIEAIYRQLCEKIEINPLGRTSVSRIVSEFDMEGIVSAPVRSRGRYGKTRLVTLKKEIQEIEDALHSDYRLRQV